MSAKPKPKMPEGPGPFVLARCVFCKAERYIGPGEVPKGDVPMCTEDSCGGVMIAVSATNGRRGSARQISVTDRPAGPTRYTGEEMGRRLGLVKGD